MGEWVEDCEQRVRRLMIRPYPFTHLLIYAFTAFSFLLTFPCMLNACPGCKESLFDPAQLPQRLATARGYALSIGLMLAMPLGLVVGVALLILRAQHRKSGD